MSTGWIVLIVVLVILVALIIGLYFLGKRAEKKQEEQNAQVEATAQNVTMLIIDKKKLRIKDSGLPEQVIAQTPFYAKLSKLPIVKAKVGPKVMSLICDATIFDEIPVKKQMSLRSFMSKKKSKLLSADFTSQVFADCTEKQNPKMAKRRKRGFVLGHCASRKNSMPANKTYQKGLSDTDKPFSLLSLCRLHTDFQPVLCQCISTDMEIIDQ